MSSKKTTIGIILLMLLAACASSSQGPAVDSQNDAKHAWIDKFYSLDIPGLQLPECLATLSETERVTKHFVSVRYWHARQMFYAVAELPETLKVKVDDQVEVWPEDCSTGKISRITRILSSNSQ
jgi:hypothetical protein